MKVSFTKSLSAFFCFHLLVILSFVLLQSCGNESAFGGMVTQPTLKTESKTVLAKTTTAPVSSIDHSADTVITLPKSGVTVTVSKTLPADKIAQLDKYLQAHKNLPTQAQQTVRPMQLDCTTHYDYWWSMSNYYQPVSGKLMGIWVTPDVISWTTAYNNYGFRELFIQSPGDISTAEGIGFQATNLMLSLPANQLITDLTLITGNSVGYYFIDEPYENNVGVGDIATIEMYLSSNRPSSKFMFTDWKWPAVNLCGGYDYNTINVYLNSSNSGIMCDQYYLANLCGSMKDFWNEYWNYYHPVHSWMNWADNTGLNAGGWPDCFSWMNAHSFNNVWLYAYQTGDEGVIQNWCATAWQYGWLLRYGTEYVNIWKCTNPGPCPNGCSWPNGGQWSVQEVDYVTEGYISY